MSDVISKTSKISKMSETALTNKYSVPILMTDQYIYDGAFASMKQRFAAEMRRMDEEMAKLSSDLMRLYGHNTTVTAGAALVEDDPATNWDAITKSPLVEGEGENKKLKLQFDLRGYEPNEVSVKILNDTLLVNAAHQDTSGSSTAYNEFHREFLLQSGTDPETVESSLSKDGVLTVLAPLNYKPIHSTDTKSQDSEDDEN